MLPNLGALALKNASSLDVGVPLPPGFIPPPPKSDGAPAPPKKKPVNPFSGFDPTNVSAPFTSWEIVVRYDRADHKLTIAIGVTTHFFDKDFGRFNFSGVGNIDWETLRTQEHPVAKAWLATLGILTGRVKAKDDGSDRKLSEHDWVANSKLTSMERVLLPNQRENYEDLIVQEDWMTMVQEFAQQGLLIMLPPPTGWLNVDNNIQMDTQVLRYNGEVRTQTDYPGTEMAGNPDAKFPPLT